MHWQATNYLKILILNSLLINGLSINISNAPLLGIHLENSYLSDYDAQSFFNSNLPNQLIEVDNIDEELLNATLFFYLNRKKTKGRKKGFHQNETLFNSCKNIVTKYSGKTLVHLKNRKKRARLKKILKKQSKKANFRGAFIEAEMGYLPILNISKREKYFYDDELDNGDQVFFLGKKNFKKKEPKPVKLHSYISLVEAFIKRHSTRKANAKIRGKEFSELGCYVQVVQKSKKKIPFVKFIWMVGGNRLGLID